MMKSEWFRLKKVTGGDWKEDVVLKQRKKENSHDDGNDDDDAHRNATVLCPRRGIHPTRYPVAEQEADTNAAVHVAAAGLLSTI
jgi:hypothetical protein